MLKHDYTEMEIAEILNKQENKPKKGVKA